MSQQHPGNQGSNAWVAAIAALAEENEALQVVHVSQLSQAGLQAQREAVLRQMEEEMRQNQILISLPNSDSHVSAAEVARRVGETGREVGVRGRGEPVSSRQRPQGRSIEEITGARPIAELLADFIRSTVARVEDNGRGAQDRGWLTGAGLPPRTGWSPRSSRRQRHLQERGRSGAVPVVPAQLDRMNQLLSEGSSLTRSLAQLTAAAAALENGAGQIAATTTATTTAATAAAAAAAATTTTMMTTTTTTTAATEREQRELPAAGLSAAERARLCQLVHDHRIANARAVGDRQEQVGNQRQ